MAIINGKVNGGQGVTPERKKELEDEERKLRGNTTALSSKGYHTGTNKDRENYIKELRELVQIQKKAIKYLGVVIGKQEKLIALCDKQIRLYRRI